MIGNIDYIIDIVAEKKGVDRRIVEVMASEIFKKLKKSMTNSDALSFSMGKLGHWVCMNRKLRRYTREYIKKLRAVRQKIEQENLLAKPDEDKLAYLIKMETIYTNRVRTAWVQLNALRTIFYNYAQRKKEKLARRAADPNWDSYWKHYWSNRRVVE